MIPSQRKQHLCLSSNVLVVPLSPPRSPSSLAFPCRPATAPLPSLFFHLPSRQWLARVAEPSSGDGPVELPPSTPSIFATDDEPSTLQVATSVLLTGAISVFLFRSIRRRAKRAKELKFRSSGAKKTLKEEVMESLKAMTPASISANSPPSPVQALLGGVSAGVIALILYKFTTTIEASLNRQTLSNNISVRQITITIRTIVNGLCYLATFVFGINSVGLFLYSGQLAMNSLMGDSSGSDIRDQDDSELHSPDSTTADSPAKSGVNGDQRSDDTQKSGEL